MKHNIESDQRRRKLFYLNEHKLRAYKVVKLMTKQNQLGQNMSNSQVSLQDFNGPRNASLTRIRNRCALTGRSRGVYRFFKLSRLCIRELFGKGYLPGLRKY